MSTTRGHKYTPVQPNFFTPHLGRPHPPPDGFHNIGEAKAYCKLHFKREPICPTDAVLILPTGDVYIASNHLDEAFDLWMWDIHDKGLEYLTGHITPQGGVHAVTSAGQFAFVRVVLGSPGGQQRRHPATHDFPFQHVTDSAKKFLEKWLTNKKYSF